MLHIFLSSTCFHVAGSIQFKDIQVIQLSLAKILWLLSTETGQVVNSVIIVP